LNQSLYQVNASGSTTSGGTYLAPGSLTFHFAQNGLDVVKIFRFDSSYVITAETEVKRNGEPVRALIQWPAGLGDMEEFLPSSTTRAAVPTSAASQLAWSVDGKQTSEGPVGGGFLFWTQPGVANGATLDGPFQYAAISDLYFAAAFLPDTPSRATMVTLHNSLDISSDLGDANSSKRPAHVLGLAIGDSSGLTRVRLYAGPKAMDTLTSIHSIGNDGQPTGQSLEPLIQFGWLTVIAKPLYLALRFLYEHGIPNWGWAIIIVTVIFNIALLPTRLMMMKQSVKMSRLQPKINVIKRKYANLKPTDPKRAEMNTEMMALYKEENVNLYGGCLPLFLQMPLFFAYYRVLANVIELRQAHWFWLTDLSNPDPLHILPILIILTMFLTQYMTPSPGMDPTQRRMMAFLMPIIFGYSMLHFPSGLALYWGTGNIINLSMQLAINRSKMGKEMQEAAAKNAAKKSKR
jgi:YidC/Oxa1 family membrane protein insertase